MQQCKFNKTIKQLLQKQFTSSIRKFWMYENHYCEIELSGIEELSYGA